MGERIGLMYTKSIICGWSTTLSYLCSHHPILPPYLALKLECNLFCSSRERKVLHPICSGSCWHSCTRICLENLALWPQLQLKSQLSLPTGFQKGGNGARHWSLCTNKEGEDRDDIVTSLWEWGFWDKELRKETWFFHQIWRCGSKGQHSYRLFQWSFITKIQ